MDNELPLLKGTVDMLVLKALTWGPMHGFGIARWIRQLTDDALQVEEGSLYPALYRMENRGWVKSEWRITENNRRARFYKLTAAGRAQLKSQTATWIRYSEVVTALLTSRTRTA